MEKPTEACGDEGGPSPSSLAASFEGAVAKAAPASEDDESITASVDAPFDNEDVAVLVRTELSGKEED